MKIVWVSPFGDGWAIAYRLREAGHKVVYVPLNGTRNGEGFLPRLDPAEHWQDYAKKADVTFVDATPASRRTRRSYEPSDLSLELARLRHFGVPLIGPTPTSELIQNDPRYFRKTMRRLGLLSDAGGVSSGTRAPHDLGHLQRLFLSAGPFGQTALVVRAHYSGCSIPHRRGSSRHGKPPRRPSGLLGGDRPQFVYKCGIRSRRRRPPRHTTHPGAFVPRLFPFTW